ncbi:hypothetical protein [Xanthomonas arboricola]|uniref:hypothetical protein n=1 Tax=Xanthomonas arboricola TaxID=56448 RepID=UPI0011B0DBA5|nr:hypothetical protein [Xanthomonas arboricola]
MTAAAAQLARGRNAPLRVIRQGRADAGAQPRCSAAKNQRMLMARLFATHCHGKRMHRQHGVFAALPRKSGTAIEIIDGVEW